MNLNFTLANTRTDESSLYVEVKRNGVRFKIYPHRSVTVSLWSFQKNECKERHPHSRELNAFLKGWKGELERLILEYESKRLPLVRELLEVDLDKMFVVKAEGNSEMDFMGFFDQVIKQKSVTCSDGFLSVLKQCRKHVIMAFELITKKELTQYNEFSSREKSKTELAPTKRLPFEQINLAFLQRFQEYMHAAKYTLNNRGVDIDVNYKRNTIAKQIKHLKSIVDAAIEANHVSMFYKKSIKTVTEDVDAIYTNLEELSSFVRTKLSTLKEEIIRDKYVVNCYLGQRYSDFNVIDRHQFIDCQIKGAPQVVFVDRSQKTDVRVEFPIHQDAVEILKKYDFNLPRICEQEFNRIIKDVAFKAGLTGLFRKRETRGYEKEFNDIPRWQLISSHTGRRSFCTNFYQAGCNIASIMAISGHKTEKEFLKYVKATVRVEVLAEQLAKIPNLKRVA